MSDSFLGRACSLRSIPDELPTSTPIYQGHVPDTGQMKFFNDSNGFVVPSTIAGTSAMSIAASVLAAGLTECCAHEGRGKVMWFPRAHKSCWKSETGWPGLHDALPDLYYIDYAWEEAPRREWFKLSHKRRIELLDASNGFPLDQALCLPINLNYEMDDYRTVRITHGSAPIFLFYNGFGYMYLGSVVEAATAMAYLKPDTTDESGSPYRAFWHAPKTAMDPFQIRSSRLAVEKLHALYLLQRPWPVRPNEGRDSLYYYCIAMNICGVETGRALGLPGLTLGAAALGGSKGVSPQPQSTASASDAESEPGGRLKQILELAAAWTDPLKATYARYKIATLGGSMAVTLFLITDGGFVSLEYELKLLLLERLELEQESAERSAAVVSGRAGGL